MTLCHIVPLMGICGFKQPQALVVHPKIEAHFLNCLRLKALKQIEYIILNPQTSEKKELPRGRWSLLHGKEGAIIRYTAPHGLLQLRIKLCFICHFCIA